MNHGLDPVMKWLDRATEGIRFGPDRREVRAELSAHLEDKTLDFQRIFPDLSWEEAQQRAASEMGDPAEIGKELAKVHKPWLGYAWLASKVLVGLAVFCLVLIGFRCGDDAYLGDDPFSELWDFDSMPSYFVNPFQQDRTEEELYLPGEDPDQLQVWTQRPADTIAGQRVEVRRAALWQEGEEQVLYCYLRLETWQFWGRGSLEPERLMVTDSLGNHYPYTVILGDQAPPEGPAYQFSGMEGYGPFHWGCQVRVQSIDPQAKWVRLNYNAPEEGLSLLLELEPRGEESHEGQ